MDWQNLFLSPNGRISRQPFWIGALILFVVGFVLKWIPVVNLLTIVLIYPWVCLYSKRLHDMGKSGWLTVAPFIVMILAVIIALVVGGAGALAAMGMNQNDPAAAASAIGGLGLAGVIVLLGFLVCFGFMLWIGLTPGEPGANQYGPSPKGEGAALTPTM